MKTLAKLKHEIAFAFSNANTKRKGNAFGINFAER